MASAEPYPSPPPSPVPSRADPILRNVLRYTVSAKEYKALHHYLITRSPPAVRKRAPPPAHVKSIAEASDEHNAAAIRASLRVFIASQTALQIWDRITARLFGRGNPPKYTVHPASPISFGIDNMQKSTQDISLSLSQLSPFAFHLPYPIATSNPLPLSNPSPGQSRQQRCRPFPSTESPNC